MRRLPSKSERYRAIVTFQVVRESEPAVRDLLDSPEAAADWARSVIPDDGREHFWIAMLDSQNRLMLSHEVSVGSLSASIVHPREVLGPAIREGAAHLILAHNHPSSDPTPSKEDVNLTRQLDSAAKILGVRIHDHIIVGSGTTKFTSLAQRGII